MRRLILVLLLCLGGVHSAQATLFGDDEAREKILELQKQLVQMQGQIQALQTKLATGLETEQQQRQAVESRVGSVENQLKSQSLLDLFNQVERLNTDIRQTQGQLEVIAHELDGAQQRQRDLYTDLDTRLRKLESTAKEPAPTPTTGAEASTAEHATADTASTPAPAPSAADELKDYEAAFALFKAGKYTQAAEAFDKFQKAYPDSKLAGNAQYWVGTARFSQRDYKGAIAAQQKLLKTDPEHEKAPDAMYSIANCQIQLSDLDAARQTLKTLVTKFPQAKITPKAKERLSQLESLKKK